jgi:hypothetical protein
MSRARQNTPETGLHLWGKLWGIFSGEVSKAAKSLKTLVGAAGFEPATLWSQTGRASTKYLISHNRSFPQVPFVPVLFRYTSGETLGNLALFPSPDPVDKHRKATLNLTKPALTESARLRLHDTGENGA